MAFGFSKPRLSPIALDFGVDSVKMLQIVPSDPPAIHAAAAVVAPAHTRHDPTAREAFLIEAIKHMLANQKWTDRRVICSIPAYQMLMQNFQLPAGNPVNPGAPGNPSQTKQQVELQMRQRFNVDPTRMVVRSLPVQEASTVKKQEVVCLAAGRDVVMRYLQIARAAKLDVVGMHSEPVAIVKAFEHLHRDRDAAERTTCFIDIGAATTKAIITHGNTIVFAKNIHAGGDHLTEYYAKQNKLTFDEARQVRIGGNNQAPAPGIAPGTAAATATATENKSAPPSPEAHDGDVLDCLIDELLLCVRYYRGLFPSRTIEKLVFLGGESHHVPICQKIARSLRIGAQLGDPLARAGREAKRPQGVDLSSAQPGWAVPMGLCLSEPNL